MNSDKLQGAYIKALSRMTKLHAFAELVQSECITTIQNNCFEFQTQIKMNIPEIFLFTLTILIYNSNDVGGSSSSLLDNNAEITNQRPKMSAFAKKAGGKWKAEFSPKRPQAEDNKPPNNFGHPELYKRNFVEGVSGARNGPGVNQKLHNHFFKL